MQVGIRNLQMVTGLDTQKAEYMREKGVTWAYTGELHGPPGLPGPYGYQKEDVEDQRRRDQEEYEATERHMRASEDMQQELQKLRGEVVGDRYIPKNTGEIDQEYVTCPANVTKQRGPYQRESKTHHGENIIQHRQVVDGEEKRSVVGPRRESRVRWSDLEMQRQTPEYDSLERNARYEDGGAELRPRKCISVPAKEQAHTRRGGGNRRNHGNPH